MKGISGFAALSMSGATLAEAQETLAESLPTDPHTRDTYRSIVDAIVPRTPQLENELGPEHVPGGLAIELEKFIIWDFNHFQEVRLDTLHTGSSSDAAVNTGDAQIDAEKQTTFDDSAPRGTGIPTGPTTKTELSSPSDGQDGLMNPEMFRIDLDTTHASSDLDALTGLTTAADPLAPISDPARFEELVEFGDVKRFTIDFADPLTSDATGPASFALIVATSDDTTDQVIDNYPYAPIFPFVFDVVAAEFLLRGQNEDAPRPRNDKFPGGGTFVQLSRKDRLRCLWEIVDGGAIDRLDGLLSPMMPYLGILKFVVMAVNGLHGFGYYTEWSGYGSTKTAPPSERKLKTPTGELQSHQQTGYPGPADGYAADWRHVISGGFRDPQPQALDLPDDLTGDDIIDGIGGDS